MGFPRGKYDCLPLFHEVPISSNCYFGFTLKKMQQSVVRCGVLTEALPLVEGEECHSTSPVTYDGAAYN